MPKNGVCSYRLFLFLQYICIHSRSQHYILYLCIYIARLATGWRVRGSSPIGGEIFRTCPNRPWGATSLLYNGHRVSSPGVKRPRHGVDHSPHLGPRLKKEQSLWVYSRVNFTFLHITEIVTNHLLEIRLLFGDFFNNCTFPGNTFLKTLESKKKSSVKTRTVISRRDSLH